MKLTPNAQVTYEKRYLAKDEDGNFLETPAELLRRVALNIASVEKKYGLEGEDLEQLEEDFFRLMADNRFMPNSPTLMNAGRELQQLSACFVLPLEDSMEGIFTALKNMALVQKTGGGTGFAFDRLRPSSDIVRSTNGVASGPISFLKIFDAATEAVKQGGTRRGANMGSLCYDHPNILEFICCKEQEDEITNFNLSITVSDDFMRKATGEDPQPLYPLINPRTGERYIDPATGTAVELDAGEVFTLITEKAWAKGDPGIIFIDEMNRKNPTRQLGPYETTNPCGEQPLLPYEACCLGSINLGLFVTPGGELDWTSLGETVATAVRFLDNVIDASDYVIPEIAAMHKEGNRKIGLGIMGWHDMLVRLGLPYDSEEAVATAGGVMKFINEEARKESVRLAEERGVFPNFAGSSYDTGRPEDRVRNATRTTIAPTGTISILAGASSGIEPYFSIAYTRKNILSGIDLAEVNPLFLEMAREEDFFSEELVAELARAGTIPPGAAVPERMRSLFKTAMEIEPQWHIRHQAAFQAYTDNAVSKTINLRQEVSVEEVREAYIKAWKAGCKGITIYRDGSRSKQVLNIGQGKATSEIKPTRRPQTLAGQTTSVRTALGNLFVTVNSAGGEPFELFAQIGKAGSDVVAFTEAVARLVSLALRCGVSVDDIVAQLEGIGGARSVGFGPNRVMSVPDAIGQALRSLARNKSETPGVGENRALEICPDCGTCALVRTEGCLKCESCGFTEC